MDAFAGGGIALGLAKAYGADAFGPAALNIFFANHVAQLSSSEVDIVKRSGNVLEAVLAGYGIGYVAPVAVIAAGQLMLGNTLNASAAVASAVTFSNPAAATCAAVGALFYGYQALSADERTRFLDTLESGLEIGRELIKSVIAFVENMLAKLLNAELLKSLRSFVVEYSSMFGKSVADITRSVGDRAVLMAHRASAAAYEAASAVGSSVYSGTASAGQLGLSLGTNVQEFGSNSAEWISEASLLVRDRVLALFSRGTESTTSEDQDKRP